MTTEKTREIISLIKKKKWTQFLESLPVGQHSYVFESFRDMDSCISTGTRINSRGESQFEYSFKRNYPQKSMLITVSTAEKETES